MLILHYSQQNYLWAILDPQNSLLNVFQTINTNKVQCNRTSIQMKSGKLNLKYW